jgi:L-ascorbate metabolism protein UlaG (beta-lactamase superfamily)
MKISKHLHSCLLVKENDKTVLIDPGIFTRQENALNLASLGSLDYILLTHEHPDHMDTQLINDLVSAFPNAKIISNPSIEKLLGEEKITVYTDLSVLPKDADIQFEEVPHESLWDMQVPQNLLFTVFSKLTHPGDSHHVDTSADILALPLEAPWGSMKNAVELALRLKPKVIIPIHDWMLKDQIRQMLYQRLQGFFKEKGIDFKPMETGEVIEV